MGLNHIATAAMIALLGAASVLHAETASQPASPATAAPTSDPALAASPIAGSESAAQPAAAPEATPSPEPAATTPETTAPAQTKGDVLTVPTQKPTATKKKKASSTPIRIVEDGMPGRGASMSQVEQHFGPPQEKLAPVGTPPITRWIYRDYTVYFEHEYVIHSVKNIGPTEMAAPVSATPSPAAPATPDAPPAQPTAPETGEAPAAQPATAPAPTAEPPAAAEPTPTKPATGQ